MDWNLQNIKVYNDSAIKMSDYFSGIGSRISDIELALNLSKTSNDAKVIEIGCGDGRDAVEIIKRVGWYEGVDPSIGLLGIARAKNPNTSFKLDDALSYNYPSNIDVVYAFASLLHVDKTDLIDVFNKVWQSLRVDGIFYISLKERDTYTAEIKTDDNGQRMFYYYNPSIIKQIAGNNFKSIHENHQTIGKTNWFTIALQKQ